MGGDNLSPWLGQEAQRVPAPFGSHGVSQTRPQSASLWVPALPAPLYYTVLGGVRAILPRFLSSPSPLPFLQSLTRSDGAGTSPAWLHAFLWEGREWREWGSLVKKQAQNKQM